MKPCSKNQKRIAWLALDALDVRQAHDLRAHLETCAGCRRYLEEISNLTRRLTAAETTPDSQASESFHDRVVSALSPQKTGWETLVAHLRGTLLNRRVALPVIGIVWRPEVPTRAQPSAQAVLEPDSRSDPPPSIAHCAKVANHSLEKLDELLTRQGNRNPSPTRIYRASNASD